METAGCLQGSANPALYHPIHEIPLEEARPIPGDHRINPKYPSAVSGVYKDHLRSATTEPWLTCGCGQINFKQPLGSMLCSGSSGRHEALKDYVTQLHMYIHIYIYLYIHVCDYHMHIYIYVCMQYFCAAVLLR